ncbi:zinc ribbon domain-containing protein [Haloarcula salinisoli]|uniref:Zinc ribbon domain-containing protein n=1 Tax=Haloarcula salinisoli TaxID=2487746 RepID=A0A8J7YAH5_9EURY|nr:zinc ribbon domain-containing protein [Halomicroarcula salinisoli]MBX0286137.1 zinc ribbon domain-containing protein [Halomicroarcula salinisoli]MBX0302375.1 zinc ribbon domain-containing protein [Halomicroarcula salinisoli]
MTDTGRKRPWLAALLAFIYPGLGHLYLREWLRALLWFGLVFSTTTLLINDSMVAPLSDGVSLEALLTVSRSIPIEASVVLFVITAFSMADAFYMATRGNAEAEVVEGAKCPHCGKELEDDLDFCHWCTTKLDRPAEPEQ